MLMLLAPPHPPATPSEGLSNNRGSLDKERDSLERRLFHVGGKIWAICWAAGFIHWLGLGVLVQIREDVPGSSAQRERWES